MKEAVHAIEMDHITKAFGRFKANDDVTIHLRKGEIHALLGENGAGKSTLMNILFGLLTPDRGTIKVNGKPVTIKDPNDATDLGIGMVHQHFKQVECFTVLQNIILGCEDVAKGVLQMDEAREKVCRLSEQYHFNIDPDAKIEDITVGMQQRVEILKMLYRDNDILIFDEPTAVLTPQEISELLEMMRNLAAEGKSILLITHKLNEIKAVADRVSILRKGKYIETCEVADKSEADLAALMVGKPLSFDIERAAYDPGEVILSVEDLTVHTKTKKNVVDHVDLTVHEGEILGIAGIDGNGQRELAYAITGLVKANGGKITLCGQDITNLPVKERIQKGLAHIPEDRLKHGVAGPATLAENMILHTYDWSDAVGDEKEVYQRFGFLQKRAIKAYTDKMISAYDIATPEGADSIVENMSGGNQQKAVIARELSRVPDCSVVFQPIRGLDVGAVDHIHRELIKMRDDGHGILLISFELSEIMRLSDRILVVFEGKIVAELDPKQTSPEEIGYYMAGGGARECRS